MPETYTNGMWQVKEGEDEAFAADWREFVSGATAWEGHGTFRLLRDVDAPSRYTSFCPWESFEAQASWKADPEFRGRIGRVRARCGDFTPSVLELVTTVD